MSAEPLGLVVTNGEVQIQPCTLYKHNPAAAAHCAILDEHHICPASWWHAAGKDLSLSPKVGLCPNCHASTHAAIDAKINGQGTDMLPRRCVALAEQAFVIAEANGLTPALTL